MAVTNRKKEEICNKYKVYLMLIYHLGNKVMLSKQLFEYAVALGIVKHKIDYWKQLDELKSYDILRVEPFVVLGRKTQNEVLTLKKYPIRFIECKEKSYDVAAVPKSNSNERILLSIFKNTYVLTKVIPALEKRGEEITYTSIITYLNSSHSSLLLNKNEGLEYLNHFSGAISQGAINTFNVEAEKEDMEALINKRKKGLKIGSVASDGKGKGKLSSSVEDPLSVLKNKSKELIEIEDNQLIKSPKIRKLETYNFDTMLNAYTYVAQMKSVGDVVSITSLLFDIADTRDVYKIALNIASIYRMYDRYLKCKFKLTVGVICYDDVAQTAVEEDSSKRTQNRISKELNELNKIQNYLKLNGIQYLDLNNIEIKFANYDLTNKYFEGIKYANILKSEGRPKGSKKAENPEE
jgi:hypothetical protein